MALFRSARGLRVSVVSDQGMRRTMNEDRVAALRLGDAPAWGEGAVVADGMGGAAGGERASRLVVDLLRERLSDWQVQPTRLGDRFLPVTVQRLTELLDAIHLRVRQEAAADPGLEGMGSTLTMLLVAGGCWITTHVGDSRVYLVRQGTITQLTADQVAGGDASLLQVIGGGRDLDPEFRHGHVEPGDLFILCTDGLTKHLRDPDILAIARRADSPDRRAQRLVDEANRRGGRDNIGVALIEVPLLDSHTESRSRRPLVAPLLALTAVLASAAYLSYLAYQRSGQPAGNAVAVAATDPATEAGVDPELIAPFEPPAACADLSARIDSLTRLLPPGEAAAPDRHPLRIRRDSLTAAFQQLGCVPGTS